MTPLGWTNSAGDLHLGARTTGMTQTTTRTTTHPRTSQTTASIQPRRPRTSQRPRQTTMSGIPLKLKLLPGKLHLLNLKVHRLPRDSTYNEAKVATATPIKLRSREGDWYFNTLRNGIHLPRPKDAPALVCRHVKYKCCLLLVASCQGWKSGQQLTRHALYSPCTRHWE